MRSEAIFLALIAFLATLLNSYSTKEEIADQQKKPQWNKPGGCITAPVTTPCRTVRTHFIKLEKGRWGWLDASLFTYERIEAVDQDYSTSVTLIETSRKHWIVPVSKVNATVLTLRPQDQIVTIDHFHKLFYTDTGALRRSMESWEESDPLCNTNPHYIYFKGRIADSKIAGIDVIGYYWGNGKGYDAKMYFAPSLGCMRMNTRVTIRNRIGFPTYYSNEKVNSFILGAPEPKLFQVPPDYKNGPPTFTVKDLFDPPLLPQAF